MILILMTRLEGAGVDLASLNPFLWYQRHKWNRRFHANPIYALETQLEAVGLLTTAIAKTKGDMSLEEKQHVLFEFQNELKLKQVVVF